MKFPVLCPRCQQGPDLHRVTIKEFGRPFFLCYECEAVYEKEEDIAAKQFRDFNEWAEERGLDPHFTNLTKIDDH